MSGAFRSLSGFNYRVYAAGGLVSNTGTWMQRIAQDWLVLTELTHHDAVAVGVTSALQFGPQLLLLPWTGLAADHLDRRKLLIVTQAIMGTLALALGLLAVTGLVRLWEVFLIALLLGCASAFDAPARQTFVFDLVGDANLSNAVALNATSFNAARMIGPAAAGLLIAAVGTGWAFLFNAGSFVAALCSLFSLRTGELHPGEKAARARGSLVEGFRYVGGRDDLKAMLAMLFLIGTFGLNFSIFISTMAVTAFHVGAGHYGFLTSMMAIGSIAGSLLAARREQNSFVVVLAGSAVFGIGCAVAALMPNIWLFGVSLVVIGAAGLTFTTATNTLMQLTTEPAMRGRVMAIRLAVALGGTPLGAPTVGWVANRFGPRCALGIGAAAGLAAAIVAIHYLARHRHPREGE